MKIICTKCSGSNIYIEAPKEEKIPETQTMDEMVNNFGISTLVYKPTTWRCKDCGYSVSR